MPIQSSSIWDQGILRITPGIFRAQRWLILDDVINTIRIVISINQISRKKAAPNNGKITSGKNIAKKRQPEMPSANIYKCDGCRKDFKTVWLPNKLCCRLAQSDCGSVGNTYSRHMMNQSLTEMTAEPAKKLSLDSPRSKNGENGKAQRNNIAPFSSSGKPTCGHFFSRDTDHRKRKIGIPPSNLVQWRSYVSWVMVLWTYFAFGKLLKLREIDDCPTFEIIACCCVPNCFGRQKTSCATFTYNPILLGWKLLKATKVPSMQHLKFSFALLLWKRCLSVMV